MIIDQTTGIWAVYGGMLLGGGGGGDLEEGLRVLKLALSYAPEIPLVPLTELNGEEMIITASLVGSPASKEKYVSGRHYERVFQLFRESFEGDVQGIITNELGAQSSTNGWVLAALTGLPFLDAPCNGRAHPTGVMGSLGLCEEPEYVSLQAAVGGKGQREVELVARGTLNNTSGLVRTAAAAAGGFVTVLRNPVRAAYVAAHGAQGAIAQSMEVGRVICTHLGDAEAVLNGLWPLLEIQVLCRGTVEHVTLHTEGGFDLGSVLIGCEGTEFEVSFWNEYMTVQQDGRRLATFPELIVVLDAATGLPQTSAMLRPGNRVILAKVPMEHLILSSSMRNRKLLEDAEKRIGKELVSYVLS